MKLVKILLVVTFFLVYGYVVRYDSEETEKYWRAKERALISANMAKKVKRPATPVEFTTIIEKRPVGYTATISWNTIKGVKGYKLCRKRENKLPDCWFFEQVNNYLVLNAMAYDKIYYFTIQSVSADEQYSEPITHQISVNANGP